MIKLSSFSDNFIVFYYFFIYIFLFFPQQYIQFLRTQQQIYKLLDNSTVFSKIF